MRSKRSSLMYARITSISPMHGTATAIARYTPRDVLFSVKYAPSYHLLQSSSIQIQVGPGVGVGVGADEKVGDGVGRGEVVGGAETVGGSEIVGSGALAASSR